MYVPDLELVECESLEQASGLMAGGPSDVALLAGGTDLLVDLKSGRRTVSRLISLDRIPSLRGVAIADGQARIGAMTTLAELDASPLIASRWAAIHDATRQMASLQIRNVATVGGNIASAVPCADLPPVLIAMDASVVLWSTAGERAIALNSFFTGARMTARRDDELLTAIVVPEPPAGFGAAYARFALREANGIAVAAVAAGLRLDDRGMIADARLVLGAVAPVPKVVESAPNVLRGRFADHDAFADVAAEARRAAEPISDIRGSAEFRRELVGVLAQRALTTAARRAREGAR